MDDLCVIFFDINCTLYWLIIKPDFWQVESQKIIAAWVCENYYETPVSIQVSFLVMR